MAKQIGLQIKGRIDDYSFYADRVHGYLVRRTGGVTSKQYKTDDRYAAARDASSEFTAVSKAGKLIRDAFGEFADEVKDGTMVNRLNKELVALKQADNKHARGERKPQTMMGDRETNKWLRIFQFNEGMRVYELFEHFSGICEYDTSLKLARAKLLESGFPKGATHVGLTLVRSVIDFEKKSYQTNSSEMTLVSKSGAGSGSRSVGTSYPAQRDIGSEAINRVPTKRLEGIEITCLQVVFYEEVNGDLVRLKGKVHGMGVVSVTAFQTRAEPKQSAPLPRTRTADSFRLHTLRQYRDLKTRANLGRAVGNDYRNKERNMSVDFQINRIEFTSAKRCYLYDFNNNHKLKLNSFTFSKGSVTDG